jgi:excisionase family DNA binding protein
MAEEFYNFEEALRELNLKEEELKRLVSEGEIRAFREGDTMKLRRADVENLKSELLGGEVVDLGGVGEEIVFEDDLETQETGMATEAIADVDTLLDAEVEEIGEVEELELADETLATPIRRTGPRNPMPEGMLVRVLTIATAVVLVFGIPVAVSLSTGSAGDLARAIADIFS